MATIKLTQTGSPIRRTPDQRKTLIGLGLNKMHRTVELQDTPGLGALTRDIELVRGLTVRGRVTDKDGKPVPGARLEYHPLGGNLHVDKLLPGSWDPRSPSR